jgi:ribosomal protein S18 acetylase RimI-like enzyme
VGREAPPFHGCEYDLGRLPSGSRITLARLSPGEAEALGEAFATMDPWATYGMTPSRLAAFFAAEEEGCARRAIRLDGELAGVVAVRFPWLHGPYLQFLGLLPGRQGQGVGAVVLDWMADEAPAGSRNLWLCVSAINTRARAFYERHGYALAAELPALAADHMDELLLRRHLPFHTSRRD